MKRIVIAIMVVLAAISTGLGSWSCSKKMESITFGDPHLEAFALVYIADAQHFFAGNGLKITIKDYETGVETINAMLNGEVDIAGQAEFPFVEKAFRQEKIRIIASVDKNQIVYLVGRKDRGIETISDLKGKKIGLPRRTVAEFYLGRSFGLNAMSVREVTLVDLKPSQLADALTKGDVDAVQIWQPYAKANKERLGANGVIWPSQSSQALYEILVCRKDWITKHPELVSRFLKSLVQAEEYMIHHPAEAKAIVQKRLKYDDPYMAATWPEHQFSLSLDQSLILAMEDEARWMIKNNLTGERTIPDFANYIYLDGLRVIKPDAVNIIR